MELYETNKLLSEIVFGLIESRDEQEWWKALFGGGRIFFRAASSSHANSVANKWGKKSGLGKPEVIKKARVPRSTKGNELGNTYDKQLGVWVEQ